jgi:hypothetical protein
MSFVPRAHTSSSVRMSRELYHLPTTCRTIRHVIDQASHKAFEHLIRVLEAAQVSQAGSED